MDFEISKRLKTVSDEVEYRRIADIGTDHAYVPIYLCNMNKIDYAIASDINKGPLEKAEKNIKKYMFENRISTRLGNGLDNINMNEVNTIVISGMGGNLIIDILKNSKELVKNLNQMVLQPQLDVYKLRKYIHSIGFLIKNEEIIIDEGKYYNIINAVLGNEVYQKEEYYVFGKILIDKKSSILKEYIAENITKYNNIIENLYKKDTEKAVKAKIKIEKELILLKEVLNCL